MTRSRPARTPPGVARRPDGSGHLPATPEGWRAMVDENPAGIMLLDAEGTILYVNAATAAVTGRAAAEVTGTSIFDYLHPDDLPASREVFAELLRAPGRRATRALQFRHADGSYRHVECMGTNLLEHPGVEAVLLNVRNIMPRPGEAVAHESEERLRAWLDAMPGLIWIADAAGRGVFYNQRWYEVTGAPAGAVGEAAWRPALHPDDVAASRAVWAETQARGAPTQQEFRLHDAASGGYRWHLCLTTPVRDAAGQIVRWHGICTDIDAQKRAEDALRYMAEASNVLSSSLDYEKTLGAVAQLSVPRFADWVTVDMVTEAGPPIRTQRVAVAHVDPAKVAFAQELYQRYPPRMEGEHGLPGVLRTGKSEIYPVMTAAMLAQGAEDEEHLRVLRELLLRSVMIVPLTARGRVLGAITFVGAESGRIYNASDLALAEDLARRAGVAVDNARLYREAQEANRIKDEFLATVSHELRTPLNAMLGWVQLLRSGHPDAATLREALDVIERNARAQAQIVEDILDVSRIITGKLRIDVKQVEMAPVVRAAIDAVLPAIRARQIELVTDLEEGGTVVSGDATRLQQVVWNLLSNAAKFTPRQGKIAVRLAREATDVLLSVQDTGRGITPEFLPLMFERFRQADSSSTRTHGGLGLGLAIVRHLVELHGGTVEAASGGIGKGAVLTVRLPVRAVHAPLPEESGGPEPAAEARTVDRSVLRGKRVLIVDDEPDARRLLTRLLLHWGAKPEAVESVPEALKQVRRERPELLISDVAMPGADGYTLIRELRQMAVGKTLPAVALTAYARAEDRRAAEEAGFDRHVSKPVEPEELSRVISELLASAGDRT